MKQYALLCLSLFCSLVIGCGAVEEKIPYIAVRGEASIFMPPDQMKMRVNITSENKDSNRAIQENNRLLSEMIAKLEKIGIKKDEYIVHKYQIEPVYEYKDESKSIKNYEILQDISVKTHNLDLKDEIINVVTENGLTHLDYLNYNIENPQTYLQEAASEAVKNALSLGYSIAEAAGLKVGKVLSIALERGEKNLEKGMDQSAGPQQVSVKAVVSVELELN